MPPQNKNGDTQRSRVKIINVCKQSATPNNIRWLKIIMQIICITQQNEV